MRKPIALAANGERRVPPSAIFNWLSAGFRDLRAHPGPGLTHGLAFMIFGWLLLAVAHDQFWLLAGAYSGFLIVAPVAVTGLYEISRQLQGGVRMPANQVFAIWKRPDRRMVIFGLLLGLAGTGWVLTSAGFITLFAPVPVNKPLDFLRHVVLAPQSWVFSVWLILGGILAAPMFASSVISMPMLLDKDVSVKQALAISWAVCSSHPDVMAMWALVLMALVGLGMLTGMLGLIVIIPWLAHASWHVYRDLVPANMIVPTTAQRD
ncbi:MAG: hypothetical protein RL357_1519 [Pseudomonadota bacterium]